MRLAPAMVGLLSVFVALSRPAEATNVLIIVADDLGADKLEGFADYSTATDGGQFMPDTPTLDDLGTAGLSFTQTWANPLCSPSRASLYTGQFPFHHGVRTAIGTDDASDPVLSTSTQTLAETLSASPYNYATTLFGKWHLGTEGDGGTTDWDSTVACTDGGDTFAENPNPNLHGFQTYVGGLNGEPESYSGWVRVEGDSSGVSTSCLDTTSHPDDYATARASDWIADQSGPWMAVVAFNAPHTDRGGDYGYYEFEDLSPACQATVAAEDACIASEHCGDSDGNGVDDAQPLLYKYLVQCLDTNVDTLLASMDSTTLQDTLIVFMGDNGTPGGQSGGASVLEDPYDRSVSALSHASIAGKATTFQTGVRVPLLVVDGRNLSQHWRGARMSRNLVASPGRAVSRSVIVEDLVPTLLDTVGATSTATMDGRSFKECLTSTSATCATTAMGTRPSYAEVYDYTSSGTLSVGRAVYRKGQTKFVLEYSPTSACMYPSAYAVSDSFDQTDLYTRTAASTVRTVKRELGTLAPSWMPGASTGTVTWCR